LADPEEEEPMQAAWVAEQDACSETALLVGGRQDRVAHQLHITKTTILQQIDVKLFIKNSKTSFPAHQGREMVEHKNAVAP
jgi:hypothetical protein